MEYEIINFEDFIKDENTSHSFIFGSGVNYAIKEKLNDEKFSFVEDFPFSWVDLKNVIIKEFDTKIKSSLDIKQIQEFNNNDTDSLKKQFLLITEIVGRKRIIEFLKS